jgi:DNA-binding XRE family transcriptional regulator
LIDDASLIDLHVGRRVRLQRKACGLSQQGLAQALGVTFQQVQKYECGSNRISASKLFQIAQALNVRVEFFFAGLSKVTDGGGEGQEAGRVADALLAVHGGSELATAFVQIRAPRVRRGLVQLAQELAERVIETAK